MQTALLCVLKSTVPSVLSSSGSLFTSLVVSSPELSWDAVIGLHDVKQTLQEIVVLPHQHPEVRCLWLMNASVNCTHVWNRMLVLCCHVGVCAVGCSSAACSAAVRCTRDREDNVGACGRSPMSR